MADTTTQTTDNQREHLISQVAESRGCSVGWDPAQYPFATAHVAVCRCPSEDADGDLPPHGGRNGYGRVIVDFTSPEEAFKILACMGGLTAVQQYDRPASRSDLNPQGTVYRVRRPWSGGRADIIREDLGVAICEAYLRS